MRNIRQWQQTVERERTQYFVIPPRGGGGGTVTQPLPWVQLLVEAGQTLITTPDLVYGIKRKVGEAKATAWIHTSRQATAVATLGTGGGAGTVASVTVTNRGSAYQGTAPLVTVSAPPVGGTLAVVTAAISDGKCVEGVYVTNAGSGYVDGENALAVTFSASPGTVATGKMTVRGGQVVAVSIVTRGTGYTGTATVLIPAPGGGGTTATATCVMVKGGIDLTVTTAGTGYLVAPTLTIAAPTSAECPLPLCPPSGGADYADGIGWGVVAGGSLTGGFTSGMSVIIVHDDRAIVPWGLVGLGAVLPLSRPADSIASWYRTLVRLTIADAAADGVLEAWVPMGAA